jgi:L-cysteine:1D-myo-inositol 2-amino-2-deoxy-alpha-D-glucopyranoside ligase
MLRLWDRRTGSLRDVEIRDRMSVYVCGITPYDAAHLGHAFTYVHFDALVRYLRWLGADVVHVQNVTDVDDDILRVSRERGVDFRELARSEVDRFHADMRAIGVQPPTFEPRATEFVPQILEDVGALLRAGVAYERGGWVYFRRASFPRYGELSGLPAEEMVPTAAERGGHPEDANKDDPLDFVLWQPFAPGEPSWDSPWGPGRPGWHIECSAMASRLAGVPVDVHGGGSDLVFPHHESEIAQAESLPGAPTPFVRHWVHTAEVRQDGEKMSKSLGNMTFVRDLLERRDGDEIRRFLLSWHYREELEFTGVRPRSDAREADERGRDAFVAALAEDLHTPRALAVLERAERDGEPWAAEGRAVLGLREPPH